jgi:hypothetical protein
MDEQTLAHRIVLAGTVVSSVVGVAALIAFERASTRTWGESHPYSRARARAANMNDAYRRKRDGAIVIGVIAGSIALEIARAVEELNQAQASGRA